MPRAICIRIRQIFKDKLRIRRMRILTSFVYLQLVYAIWVLIKAAVMLCYLSRYVQVMLQRQIDWCNVSIYLWKLQSYGRINVYISVINRLKFYQYDDFICYKSLLVFVWQRLMWSVKFCVQHGFSIVINVGIIYRNRIFLFSVNSLKEFGKLLSSVEDERDKIVSCVTLVTIWFYSTFVTC